MRSILHLMALRSWPLVVAGLLVAITGFAVAIGALAQERPGQQASPADIDAARAVLGAPAPEVRAQIGGLRRTGLGIDPPAPDGSRRVHLSYGIAGKNMVLLTVFRGNVSADGEVVQLPEATATVSVKSLLDGTQDVRYAWNRNGLALVLHVNISGPLTWADAEMIAASVR